MVSSVSFGNFATINGKNVLAGSQSGIDTTSLINALVTVKQQPATNDQTKITANTAQISAFNSLSTLMTNLQNSVDALRNPGGLSTNDTNAFDARSPFLTITDGLTASDYVGVQTANGAPIGSYSIQVDHLATAEIMQSGTFSSRSASVVNASGSNTAGAFAAGTFQINGANVTLNQNASLNDVMSAINSVSTQSGVTASIVGLSSSSYELLLTSKSTGAANAIKINDPNGVLPTTGTIPTGTTTDPTNVPVSETMFGVKQPAGDAQLEFNNQTITRPSNTITDLLDNTTVTLYAPTNNETVSLQIDKNDQSIATAIGNFADAYNAMRTFLSQQQQRNSSGNLVSSAVLNNNPTLNTIMNTLASMVSSQLSISIPSAYASGQTSAPTRLGDLGITLGDQAAGTTTDASGNTVATPEVDNIMQVDASTLSTNLDSYFDQVRQLFEFTFTPSTANLSVYQRDNNVTNSNFNIAIDTSQPVGQQAQITSIDGSALSTPLYLNYTTTTTEQSSSFTDVNTTPIVGAAGSGIAGQFSAGTIQVNGVSVTLNEGDTLTGVANDINNAATGVTASIVSDGGTGFKLSLTGSASGTSGVNITDPDGVVAPGLLSVTSSSSIVSGAPNTDLSSLSFSYAGNGDETISKANPISAKDFTLSIDTTQPAAQQAQITKMFGATLVTPISMTYTQSGGSALITGPAGTNFAGLQMIYTGTGQDTIDVGMQQGIADQLYNTLDGMINGTSATVNGKTVTTPGVVASAVSNLTDQNTDLQTDITKINDQVTTYKNDLLTKYANMEAAISAANQLLQLLTAQSNAQLTTSGLAS